MTKAITTRALPVTPRVKDAWDDVGNCFERFCLTAGIEALQAMLDADAAELCGERHARSAGRVGYRWGTTQGKIPFHGGNVDVARPRVRRRGHGGSEMELPTWTEAMRQEWLGKWAMNLMLINVSTRKIGRAVRLPEDGLAIADGDGTSKSAASRRFVALSSDRLAAFMAADLSKLDLLVIQIDGLHVAKELVLLAAIGIDAQGRKHPLGLVEGASENRVTAQALIDSLVGRGLDPSVCRLFVVDGAKALTAAIRRTFGKHTPIQRCQVHKARNVVERCPKKHVAGVKRALRQAWEEDDAGKAERQLKELARKIEREAPGVAGSIREGLDEMLTVSRLGLPKSLRRALACTNAIENMQGTIRRVSRNVKRWQHAEMALRWAAAGMMEAAKGFRRLKAYKQLPRLRTALDEHASRHGQHCQVALQHKAA